MSTIIGLLQILVISSLGLLTHRHDANAVPLQRTATPEGWVAIEEVLAGEVVWTYDVSRAQWQPVQVAKVFEHAYEGDMVRLQVANDRVVSTGNHPYWVVDGKSLSERGPPTDVPDYQRVFSDQGRWVEARDLQAGDLLRTQSGTAQIAKVETFTDTTRVYNLEVATYATYAVSPQALLVHNKSMRNTSLVDDVGDLDSVVSQRLQTRLAKWKRYRAGNPGGMNLKEWVAHTKAQPWGHGKQTRMKIGGAHGNRLSASGPHDVYAILDAQSGNVLRFGETGRGYMTRFSEWRRYFSDQGIDIQIRKLRTTAGKSSARALETRYIRTYEKIFGHIPPYQRTYH